MNMKMKACVVAALASLPLTQSMAQRSGNDDSRVGVVAATGFARDRTIGYHALLGLETRTPLQRLRLRAEGLVADFGTSHTSSLAFTVLVAALERTESPYVLAGFATADSAGWQRGFTLGAGWRFRLADHTAFAESRLYSFHDPSRLGPLGDDWRYVYTPISIGIRF